MSTLTAIIVIKFIVRCTFYYYMMRKYEIKIIIPLILYGIFEIACGYIDVALE